MFYNLCEQHSLDLHDTTCVFLMSYQWKSSTKLPQVLKNLRASKCVWLDVVISLSRGYTKFLLILEETVCCYVNSSAYAVAVSIRIHSLTNLTVIK